jgi:pyrroloquinoline quinone (PQQ) biosynthesis protein C
MIRIRYGEKLSPDAAKNVVDELCGKVAARWKTSVNGTPFMMQLRNGKLSHSVLKNFFRNWGAYTIEIDTLVACSYQRHLPFLKTHRELMGPLGEKIADGFMHPKPPGHCLVMLETAKAFGLTEDEVFSQPLLSQFRAKIDFMRGVLFEGTAAEWYGAIATEEQIGQWSAVCCKALMTHYGFTRKEAIYFTTQYEADAADPERGIMGHGSFNRRALQKLLESGMASERPTDGVEYCAMTSVDLHGLMLRAGVEAV